MSLQTRKTFIHVQNTNKKIFSQRKLKYLNLIRMRCMYLCCLHFDLNINNVYAYRAVRYDDIYRMDEIKSLSFHIMFYRGVAKYIVYGKTFS